MTRLLAWTLPVTFTTSLVCHAAPPAQSAASSKVTPIAAGAPAAARFDRLVADYYAEWLPLHPTSATGLGHHEWDARLEEVSAGAMKRETARLRDWRSRVAGLSAAGLDPGRAADRLLLERSIEATLLELEETRSWRRHPATYPGRASYAIYLLIKRNFAPTEERLRRVIARERLIPKLLDDGFANLADVHPVALDIARDELPGTISFFTDDVPLAFADVKDPALQAELKRTTAGVVAALRRYGQRLDQEIAPRARGSFALGAELFRRKLAAEELIDTPLDALLAEGEAELRRLQAAFRDTARTIDPTHSVDEVLVSVEQEHETPARLIGSVQGGLAALRKFLVDKQLVTLPSEVLPRVEETPPFMRATTLASMDTPGPFESRATEAYYNVTLPDPKGTAAQQEDFMRGAFNRSLVEVVSIHEAFPGHYVQFIWLPRLSSVVRKYEGAASNSEGWAHYCEQMMLDEGYGAGDARLRLMQLRDALLRAARYVAAIRMHTLGMTYEEAIRFFHVEGMQSVEVSRVEARRGTVDPTYLVYTWGKLQLLRLRDEARTRWGAGFSLRRFHDAVLAEGALPLPLVRAILFGGGVETLDVAPKSTTGH